MYKVGNVFMEDSVIIFNHAGQRVTNCPICGEEIILEDDEVEGDTVLCLMCNTPLKLC